MTRDLFRLGLSFKFGSMTKGVWLNRTKYFSTLEFELKGVFGLSVAVKKTVVGCEL
jgi:hypothetical protein